MWIRIIKNAGVDEFDTGTEEMGLIPSGTGPEIVTVELSSETCGLGCFYVAG
jgi:hypothetical protein